MDQPGEHPVDRDPVGQIQGVGDAHGPVMLVVDLLRVQAVLVREDGGAGDVEDVVHGRQAADGQRLEPVEDLPAVQLQQADVR